MLVVKRVSGHEVNWVDKGKRNDRKEKTDDE
jgi:hypothetical protein